VVGRTSGCTDLRQSARSACPSACPNASFCVSSLSDELLQLVHLWPELAIDVRLEILAIADKQTSR
jgi:hypothetical protein